MKIFKNFLFFYLMTILVYPSKLLCSFKHIGVSARATGMGNAFTGISDDVSAIYFNSAGLGFTMNKNEISADYSRLLYGLTDNTSLSNSFIGYILSFKKIGCIGAGFSSLNLSGTVGYNTAMLSYAKKIKNLSMGLTTKLLSEQYIHNNYTQNDPVFEYGNKNYTRNFSFDIGIMLNLFPKIFAGANIMNINTPLMRLKQTDKISGDIDKIPLETQIGIAFRDKYLSAAIDILTQNKDYKLFSGFEKWFFKNKTFAVRTGAGTGSRNFFQISLGTSFYFRFMQLDYALTIPLSGIGSNLNSHRITFTYKFSKPSKEELDPTSLEYSYSQLDQNFKELQKQFQILQKEKQQLQKAFIDEAQTRVKEKIEYIKRSSTETVPEKYPPISQVPETKKIEPEPLPVLKSIPTEKFEPIEEKPVDQKKTSDETEKIEELKEPPKLEPVKIQPVTEQPLSPEKKSSQPIIPEEPEIEQKPKKIHIVKEGDTLASIAEKYLGSSSKWIEIYKINKNRIPGGRLQPGTILTIP